MQFYLKHMQGSANDLIYSIEHYSNAENCLMAQTYTLLHKRMAIILTAHSQQSTERLKTKSSI